MFVGRSELASLIDQLVSVDGGDQVQPDTNRPVLVIEGSGGSGRSRFLAAMRDKWAPQAPTAWVDARLIQPDARELTPVLLTVLLGLSRDVQGYRMRFPRVITAYIAMKEPITEEDPNAAADVMRRRLAVYGKRAALIELVGGLVRAAGQVAAGATHVPEVAAAADEFAPYIVDGLRRSPLALGLGLSRALRDAVEWFGHQDRGLTWQPYSALVLLSRQAAVDTESVRRDVDELLATALLADLRDSLVGLENRPYNAVVLLDDGDMPAARAFTTALVRVQGRVADPLLYQATRPADPLVVVTVTGGSLVKDLGRLDARPVAWTDSREGLGHLPKIQGTGAYLPVQVADYSEENVRTIAQNQMWPPTVGSGTVSHLTYRLTGGHAEATRLVLRALQTDPARLDDLGQVLRDTSSTAPATVEEHLLDKIVGALRASGPPNPLLRQDLVTLAAARNATEAKSLTDLLQAPTQELLLTSRTLWSGRVTPIPPVDHPPVASSVLAPLVRYLGLRALAGRTDSNAPTWDTVFGMLRDRAEDAGDEDLAGILHHELALGNRDKVVNELVGKLSTMTDEHWLALLDHVTMTPDPRQRFTITSTSSAVTAGHRATVARLVEGQHTVSDPQISSPETLKYLYSRLSNDFRHLAGNSRAFLQRAEHYTHLASTIS